MTISLEHFVVRIPLISEECCTTNGTTIIGIDLCTSFSEYGKL